MYQSDDGPFLDFCCSSGWSFRIHRILQICYQIGLSSQLREYVYACALPDTENSFGIDFSLYGAKLLLFHPELNLAL